MGFLVDGKMGKQKSRDRWLGMEKTQYHFLRCFSENILGALSSFSCCRGRGHIDNAIGKTTSHHGSRPFSESTVLAVGCVFGRYLVSLKCLRCRRLVPQL